jgi:cobalt-zinc-cadmium efflux system outer membrane protein
MNQYRWSGSLLAGALLMLACAPAGQSYRSPVAGGLGRDLPHPLSAGGGPVPPHGSSEEPAGDLTLRGALAAALLGNPRLAAWSWEVRAREAEALQAGLRPNPELAAEWENFSGGGDLGGVRNSEATLSLSQTFELAGRRSKRRAVAERERNIADLDYEGARIEVLTETTKAFVDVLAAQERLALAGDRVEVAEEGVHAVSRRVAAGSASPVEEHRARVELESGRIEKERAVRALAAARTGLAAAWGAGEARFHGANGSLEEVPPPPSLEQLLDLVERSPAVTARLADLAHRRAVLELERTKGTPDLSLGAGVRYLGEAGEPALVVGLGLPLPVFDRGQGEVRAAEMRVRKAEEERRGALVRIRADLTARREELLAAESEARSLRDRALPEAETAFQSAREAYLRGSMRFTDVLDTRRMFYELKGRYFDALVRVHHAVADIEGMTGEPIDTARAETTSGRSRP